MNEDFYALFRKFIQILVLTLSFAIIFSSPSLSQISNSYSPASLAEKIYVQLDGKVYTTDKTIWLKSIVTNAFDHVPSQLSGVLYTELIDPYQKIIEKKLIKLENGIGVGSFDLNQSYPEGVYTIRAYTEWNKNFGSDFFFTAHIHVFATVSKRNEDPINSVTLIEKQGNERRLNACFDPFAIDSLHKKELTVFITHDNKKDSISVQKNKDDKYLIDYAVPVDCPFVTLRMQTQNLFSFTKTVVLNKDYIDLQFFPESGELVHGLPGKVGFKALDLSGKGKMAAGEIVDKEGKPVTYFKSNQLGMGTFTLPGVDSSETYFARLKSPSEENLSFMYPLPHISVSGNVLSVINNGDKIRFIASSSYLGNDSIYLQASCRGLVYLDLKRGLKDGKLILSVPANQLPEGIIAFTMMDSTMHPLAERLYFNERPECRINIALSTDKDTYLQRELTKLNIETTNTTGDPVNANLSLLVINKGQMGQIQGMGQNILSWFLLSSELKGEIENPGFYFNKNEDRHSDLEALLLTQGWRKYLYTKPVNNFLFRPEPQLTVSGSVGGVIFQKRKKGVALTMMTFGKDRSVQTQTTDSLGRFNFNVNDEYGQNLNIFIQSAKKSGKKMNYTIALNKKESPPITFYHLPTVGKVDSVVHQIVEKNMERKKVDDSFPLSAGNILLNEVVVEGYKITPERKKVMDRFGKPDQVISGKAIQDKEEKWSYGLYSVLLFKFPDKVIIKRNPDGELHAGLFNREKTLVVIDGIPVNHWDYSFIPIIPPGEVTSFEIIEYADNFFNLYREVFPEADPRSIPLNGNVIAIYTHAGNGIFGATTPVGILKATVPVFSVPREFYAPKYENLQPSDWYKPDLRALVHWEPVLGADSLGKASTTFYNADNTGEMQVVVEAISEKGEIGYQEIVYEVKKGKK